MRRVVSVAGTLLVPMVLLSCSGGDSLPCAGGDRLAVALSSGEDGNHQQIALTGADGEVLERLTPEDQSSDSPSFSGDGERIVYAVGQGDYESAGPTNYTLWTMDSDGSDRTRITGPSGWTADQRSDETVSTDHNPRWSPVDDEILYSHFGPSSTESPELGRDGSGLYIVTPGEVPRRLTAATDGTHDGNATWSPDGEQIAFIRQEHPPDGAITSALMIIDRDGQNLERVADSATNWVEAVLWSPDGDTIVLGGGQTVPPIGGVPVPESLQPSLLDSSRLVDVATRTVTPLGDRIGRMRWSADGERLYATLVGAGRGGFVVMEVGENGSDAEPVTHKGEFLVRNYQEFDVTACG